MNTTPQTNDAPVAYCRTCGKPLREGEQRDVHGVIYCQDCLAQRISGTLPPPVPNAAGATAAPVMVAAGPNPALAAILGIIPGVGAMYNGQYVKGVVHVLIFAALASLADHGEFFGILIPFFFFYMIFDAFKTAKSFQTGQPAPDLLGINRTFGDQNWRYRTGSLQQQQPADTAAPKTGAPVGAILLIGLGVIFLLNNLNLRVFAWVDRFWPILLIALGAWLFMRRIGAGRTREAQ